MGIGQKPSHFQESLLSPPSPFLLETLQAHSLLSQAFW